MGGGDISRTAEEKPITTTTTTTTNKGKKKKRDTFRLFGVEIVVHDEETEPLNPTIKQKINERQGTKPVFLYKKKLEDSDVEAKNNRLFITEPENLMDFLSEEENACFENSKAGGKKGIKVMSIDPKGQYHELVLGQWPSLNMAVLKQQWSKLVCGNNAKAGDGVELWGFRMNSQLCLAVNFTRGEGSGSGAGSMSTS